MIVLALDTTTRAGSAAVIDGGRIRAQLSGDATLTHGQRLPADLIRVVDQAGVALDDVDLLAVAAGPGSFTGLRVGIAAMQGIAFAKELKIVPVSALDALARDAADGRRAVAAWMDAQRGQVYAALYAPGGHILIEPTSVSPEETLAAWAQRGAPDAISSADAGQMAPVPSSPTSPPCPTGIFQTPKRAWVRGCATHRASSRTPCTRTWG